MNIDGLEGRKKPGLELHRADAAVAAFLSGLPDAYIELLKTADGMMLASGACLYGSSDLLERNETLEVQAYLPGHVAVGDDGGGQLFLLQKGRHSPVLRAGMGAIGSRPPLQLAESIASWIELGCPVQSADELQEDDPPDTANVYLDVIPGGKITNLITIKNELGLALGMAELKQLSANLPACLVRNVPYGKFRKRCEALNAQLGPCLSLRAE